MSNKTLPTITSAVTYLEMNKDPKLNDIALDNYTLRIEKNFDVRKYIDLYKKIGRDYIWNYRAGQTEQEIANVIHSDKTRIYVLYNGSNPVGMAEIDMRNPRDVEIVHFGLVPDCLNKGIGKNLLHKICHLLWKENIDRIWLSTCGMDHPKAPSFYQNAGFSIFKTKEAAFKDYRFTGFYNMNDAPQIPYGRKNDSV